VTAPDDRLEALLAVQALDTDLDRHDYQRANLPERAELMAADDELALLEQRLAAARAQRDQAAVAQEAVEKTLSSVEGRAAELKKLLYGGTVSATRDLQAMAAELDSLNGRVHDLESRVLEGMEVWEPLDSLVDTLEADKAARRVARAAIEARLAVRETQVDAEIDVLRVQRGQAGTLVPADLAATYDQLRRHLGGVGAARLVGSRCGGCFLTLPATELDRLRHQQAGAVSFCEQCGRILVPTH
jgi:hypothetical protein